MEVARLISAFTALALTVWWCIRAIRGGRRLGLPIAAGVLVILAGVIWWSNKKQEAAGKAPADTTTKLLAIPDDQFQEVEIKKVTGEVLDLKRAGVKWQIAAPKPLPADQDAAGSLVSALASLSSVKLIDEKATDLKQYGLDMPTLDIRVVKKDGKTAEVLIGDDTLTNSGAYAKLPGDPRVFTISTFTKSSLDKRPDDLRDKRLLTFDQDKLLRVELQAKGAAVEFGKNGQSEWQILKPRPLRADSSQVETLVGKLRDAKMDLTAPDKDAAAKYADAARVATVKVTDTGGTQTLEVRKDKDKNYYAKSSVVEGVHKIVSDVGGGLDKGLDDFRNKKLFDFGFSDPGRIDLKGASYTKSGDKWMSGARTMDNSTVQNLIDKLRDLSASKFVETGGGEPVFEAAVTSNSGKRLEKVVIRKQGTQYFAQRENEPSIYEIDGKAVDDLQQAVSGVKEAPPEPAKKK
ncbi:MAG: DUF4340 domain-containing protein [Acidobacteriia bacterium]|nr:DUF4340 domain-containing protein [Terriglobia bacterium]